MYAVCLLLLTLILIFIVIALAMKGREKGHPSSVRVRHHYTAILIPTFFYIGRNEYCLSVCVYV